jgi:thiol-disulfide isomerase/thioredoxin
MMAVLVLSSSPALALQLGDDAPPLSIAKWIQGSPVNVQSKDDTVYVIEFWATWCPPCRLSIPDLNELNKTYASKKVVIIGITQEDEKTVQAFFKEQAIDYTIAQDEKSQTWKNYAESTGINGIPYAFIVKNGRLWWHGSPFDDLEEVIDRIQSDGYSLEDERRAVESALIEEEMAQLLELWMQEYLVYANFGRDKDSADGLGKKILAQGEAFPEMLGVLAWHIATRDALRYRDLTFAFSLSKKACDLTGNKDPDLLDTHGHVLFAQGKQLDAIAVIKKALVLTDDEEMTQMLLESLHMMEEHP